MKRLLSSLFLSGLLSFAMADATSAIPQRVGPVSIYGALGTSGNKVISLSTNKQVMLRGMSLFWSDATGSAYYNSSVISWAAQSLGIDVFRFAMGVQYYDSDGGSNSPVANAYIGNESGKEGQLDNMVRAAIENDVYIIVDWHSHRAEKEQSQAVSFFTKMATKYKDVPNIIWEVYNEPTKGMSPSTIAGYANAVIGAIRNSGSKNLALVGTPDWSQMTSGSCGTVNQSNVGYVFHFYAASHSLSSFKGNIESCLNAGNAVFVTEWGTTDANGSGSVNTSEAGNWTNYMDQKMISNCNWSLRHADVTENGQKKTEASAMFKGEDVLNNKSLLSSAQYTTSGSFVKQYLTSKKRSWADSLTAGARSGSCAFAHLTVSEMDGSKSGVGKSGCSYTSSNDNVATIGTDGSLSIKGAGYAVMTGNDGTKSVVTVEAMPEQSVGGLNSFTCSVKELKSAGSCTQNYTGQSGYEYQITTSVKSSEGGEITCTSDNPEVVTVSKATCTSSHCYKYKGEQQWIATFTGAIGKANINVKVPAVSGYKAMDSTITVEITKAPNVINPANFKDMVVAYNSTTELPATAHTVPVTYSLSAEGYGTISGNTFIAGDKDATILIIAKSEATDIYAPVDQSIVVTIGNGSAEVIGAIAPKTIANMGIRGTIQNGNLMLQANHSGFAKVQIYAINGRDMVREEVHFVSAGANVISMGNMARGVYFVKVKQSSSSLTIPWRNK